MSEPAMKAHLADCADCSKAAADASRLARLLGNASAPALPASFNAGLQSKLAVARAQQEQAGWLTRRFARMELIASTVPRRIRALRFGASLAAAAALVGGFLLLPHVGGRIAPQGSTPGAQISSPSSSGMIAPLPASLQQGDAAFIAACSSQNAQDSSPQSVADPSANALAASLDGTRIVPGQPTTSDSSNSSVD